ncbi:Conserved_hypothetical protein [Hexamita inflata]|uniref:Uncharacterized protein n=1 Tax=Hexamita inflata TaxID=28002 RepID=A0AA86PQM0_9EUKA|nr:Conserved hypothetical protein [Hexamita inflata]
MSQLRTPSKIPTFDDSENLAASQFQPSPISAEYAERLKQYQLQKQEKMKKLQAEADKELKLKPEIIEESKNLADKRAQRLGETLHEPITDRMFKSVYEKQKAQQEIDKKAKEEREIQTKKENEENAIAPWKRAKLTDAEKDEMNKLGYTFQPAINKDGPEIDHGVSEVEYLLKWDAVRKEKIAKMQRVSQEKILANATGVPERVSKEKSDKMLKNKEIESMKVEDRLFKRSAENLKKYKGVEVNDAENSTFKPELNPKSLQMVSSKRDSDIFESLYKKGVEKLSEQKQQELRFTKTSEEQSELLKKMFDDSLQQIEPGREQSILQRYEVTRQKQLEEEARRRMLEEQNRRPKMTERSEMLAQQRRAKIEAGVYSSISKQKAQLELEKSQNKNKSMLCQGTVDIMKNKVSSIQATERLYNYSKILQQQKSVIQPEEIIPEYKPKINSYIKVDTTFDERNDALLQKRQKLIELKRQKDAQQEQKEQNFSYKPQITAMAKSIHKILHETSTTAEAAKVSQQAALANDKFIHRLTTSRKNKEEDSQRLVPKIENWKLEPTTQEPFQMKSYDQSVGQKISQETFDFIEQMENELKLGFEDSLKPEEQTGSQYIDVRTTTREAGSMGEMAFKIEGQQQFTQFHKLCQGLVFNLFDQKEYVLRRSQRTKDEALLNGIE